MRETVLAEVAQRSPTSPETNLESRAMQVRVPWTQAWLCTKDFHRKCTGAGVAAKSRFPAMQPSEVPFMQEDGPDGGVVAAVEPLDSEDKEAEEEDIDNRNSVILQYFQ
ncbi:hypothetical protein NDU88_008796 [Pleurodeles waltl]|uniref:Uncharacterized protein n=1 Tax=Pleurodeles waltl TaxID=8319 RepID=A0AAV7N899_PLEWA|nr:hypothetical protein NDU88_008796 [Pleurodeles waltl]